MIKRILKTTLLASLIGASSMLFAQGNMGNDINEILQMPCENNDELLIATGIGSGTQGQQISIVGNSLATVQNNGYPIGNTDALYGFVYGINTGGEQQITYKEIAYSDDLGLVFQILTIDIVLGTNATPMTFIEILESDRCAGTIKVKTNSSAKNDYLQWYYNGSTVGIPLTTSNITTLNIGSQLTDPFDLEVEGISNNCGAGPSYYEIYNLQQQSAVLVKGINLPQTYCGGRENTFTVKNPIQGVEYRWTFEDLLNQLNNESSQGLNKFSFSPDFGPHTSQQYQGNPPGDVIDFKISVEARSSCAGGWVSLVSETVNGVTYTGGCNNNNQGPFSIILLPNPAQNHVTVKFPKGGNSKKIRIVDAYGIEKRNITTTSAAKNINISNLPLGTYTIIGLNRQKGV